MARKLVVEIVGDASSFERSLVTANKSTKTFTREVERAGRGAVAGTGLFRSMGRSIAFASGAFLGFSSASKFLTDSINAARDAGVAQRSLAAQMRASGESFQQYRYRIEQVATSYERLGFNNEQVIQSLTVLERGTGHINQAIRLQGLTADIARAKNIDLAAAAQAVAKVFGGQETALRRAVPGLSKTAHGWDLIREAQQKMAGQALAGTTASERFNATLHNTQVIIGTALLPILNKYLGRFAKFLDEMNRSGKLAKDVNQFAAAISVLADGLGRLFSVIQFGWGLYQKAKGIPFLGEMIKYASPLNRLKLVIHGVTAAWNDLFGAEQKGKITDQGMIRAGGGADLPHGPPGLTGPDPTTRRRRGVSAALRNQWFDARIQRMLTRAQYDSLREQLRIYKQVAAIITARIAVTKDITRKLNLEDQLLAVQYQSRQTRQQIAQQAAQEAQARRQRLAAARQAASDRLAAAQMRLLGLDPSGQPLTPGINALRRRLASIREAIAGTRLATPAREGLLNRIQKLLLGGHLRADVRSAIAQIFDDIRSEISNQSSKLQRVGFVHPATSAIMAGLGLSPAQQRALRFRISQIGPGGQVHAGASLAFAGAGATVYHIGTVHVTAQNTKQLEHELARRSKARSHNRRGAR